MKLVSDMNSEELLRSLLNDVGQEVTMFAVLTRDRAQAHKYLITDGLVHYNDERLEPEVALERWIEDHPTFIVVACYMSRRTPSGDGKRGYVWEGLGRVDDWVDPRIIRIAELEAEIERLRSEI
jgi:hypothetical protein